MSVAAKDRLRAAIDAYRASVGDDIGEDERKVLDRLTTGKHATEAAEVFAKFEADDRAARVILKACVQADLLNRSFLDRLNTETESLSRLEYRERVLWRSNELDAAIHGRASRREVQLQ